MSSAEENQSIQKQKQVSLRGNSASEISRDALLRRVSRERETRSYNRRASAAALSIQKVWRRHTLMKQVATKLQEEWEVFVGKNDLSRTATWISNHLLRPFLFFTSQLITNHQKIQFDGRKHLMMCFEILLKSINSTESENNFCSLALGTHAEKATWLNQAKKLVSLCAFLLAEHNSKFPEEDMTQVTSLGIRVIFCLTDPKGWSFGKDDIREFGLVKKLLNYMVTRKSCLYMSIRKYILKLSSDNISQSISPRSDNKLLITVSAITLVLRPFHAKKLGINDLTEPELMAAAEEYYISILTIPYLLQRLPSILLPALRHVSSLLPCLKVQLTSKEKLFAEMSIIDHSGELNSVMAGVPCLGWVLANILNLSIRNCSDSVDSGCFVEGVDLQIYIDAICCLANNFLKEIEIGSNKNQESDDCKDSDGAFCQTVYSVSGNNSERFGKPSTLYINQFKPVYQQWYLRALLTITQEGSSSGSKKLKLLDVAFFYSHMLRIIQFMNPLVGALPILNMLSFTPGFLSLLWKALDEYIFGNNTCKSGDSDLQYYRSQCQKLSAQKKQKGVLKDAGDKWAHVLQKITRKSDVDSYDSKNENAIPDLVVGDFHESWEVDPLIHGPQGVSKDLSILLHLFCAAYAHLLLVLDDIEFYEKQVPFTLEQQLKISSMLNNFVYNSFIHSVENNKLHVDAAIRCLHLLYERDCRRKFCPTSLWVAPAQKSRLAIAEAARAHEAAFTNIHLGDTTTQNSSIITTMPHVFPFEERSYLHQNIRELH